MGRILLVLAMLFVLFAMAALVVSVWNKTLEANLGKNGEMAMTTLQKASYVALIIVLFGVTSGWLGGL